MWRAWGIVCGAALAAVALGATAGQAWAQRSPTAEPGADEAPLLKVEAERAMRADAPLVRYALRVHGGSGTISIFKRGPGAAEARSALGLVPPEALEASLAGLEGCGLRALRDAAPVKNPHESWVITIVTGEGVRRLIVSDPGRQGDGRHGACLEVLRGLAEGHAGLSAARDVSLPQEELGFLQVDSAPRARVWIDGADTGEEAPVQGLPLRVGEHVVTFVEARRGLRKSYTIRIMAGMTTNLDVALE